MKTTIRIRGTESSLLMHNRANLADPLSKWSKEIKKITALGRKKTEKDLKDMGYLEFMGGLYLNSKNVIVLPGFVFKAAIVNAMKREKGMKIKLKEIVVTNDAVLEYKGPKDLEKLYASGKFTSRVPVKITMGSALMRTRPEFKEWEAEFVIDYNKDIFDLDQVKSFIKTAGEQFGVGDWRPEHGTFDIVSVK